MNLECIFIFAPPYGDLLRYRPCIDPPLYCVPTLRREIENGSKKISNLENYISVSEIIVGNISKYWASEGLATQKRLQELVFPDGLVIDTKNRGYLTKKTNSIFVQSAELVRVSAAENKKGTRKNPVPSLSVARMGLEPMASGL